MSLSKKEIKPLDPAPPTIEYIYLTVNKTPITSGSFGGPGNNYQASINGKNLTFSMQSSVSGCGLGLFGNWVGSVSVIQNKNVVGIRFDEKLRKAFSELVASQAKTSGWWCLIATLGDAYVSKTVTPTVCETFIQSLGFKEVHKYRNLVHGDNYDQTIYTCDVKDLK